MTVKYNTHSLSQTAIGMATEHGDQSLNPTMNGPTAQSTESENGANVQHVSVAVYRLLQAQHQALYQQFAYVLSIGATAPQRTQFIQFQNEPSISNRNDDDDDDDEDETSSTSSIELDQPSSTESDENDQEQQDERNTSFSSINSAHSSDSMQSSGFPSGEIRSIPFGSLDASNITPDLYSRIIQDNIRLKKRLKEVMQKWCKDNATGTDSIQKLRRDVITLKIQKDKIENEIGAQNEELKDKNSHLIHQMKEFKEDFEKERDGRTAAVNKIQDAVKTMKRLKDEIQVLKQEKNRYKDICEKSTRLHQSVTPGYYQNPGRQQVAPNRIATGGMTPRQPAEHSLYRNRLPMVVATDSAIDSEEVQKTHRKSLTSSPQEHKTFHTEEISSEKYITKDLGRPDPAGTEEMKRYKDEKKDSSRKSSDEEC